MIILALCKWKTGQMFVGSQKRAKFSSKKRSSNIEVCLWRLASTKFALSFWLAYFSPDIAFIWKWWKVKFYLLQLCYPTLLPFISTLSWHTEKTGCTHLHHLQNVSSTLPYFITKAQLLWTWVYSIWSAISTACL